MFSFEWIQLCVFIFLLLLIIPLLGRHIAHVLEGEKTFLHPLLDWLELVSYKISGVNPHDEMTWQKYTKTLLLFNLLGFLTLLIIQLIQYYLPLNPQQLPGVPWALAFNTAISFATNTNWQAYAGETTLSYATQMIGLTPQNFLSAATGFSVLFVLIRGIKRKTSHTIGNFWADLVRSTVYILLPLSILLAICLVSQGVVQTFSPYVEVNTLEGVQQTIPLGPAASQVAIKQLGTNGGGFFNTNSAHPFENPTGLSNFLQTLAILIIPAASVYAYGVIMENRRHAWLLLLVMFALWAAGLTLMTASENTPNPIMGSSPFLEGKETRFGIENSLLWTASTTATSNGSVNAMLSSLSPLAGGIALFNIMLGEVIFGGVGVGLCSMLMFVLLTVFLSGLMVGRTPEYMGKKIEKREIQWVTAAILIPGIMILIGAGAASVLPAGISSQGNQGPHGLTEILYAFSSAAGNNGSAFAGLNANTDFYNLTLGLTMLMTRLAILVPSLAIAGTLVTKKVAPPSIGTFSTDTLLFMSMLTCVIMIVGALTFFPAFTLGPVIEQLLMLKGRTF